MIPKRRVCKYKGEKVKQSRRFSAIWKPEEQGTLRSGVRPIWKMVRGCLEDQRYGEAVENGQAALEMLQEERSEKAGSERIARKKEGGNKRMYPDLAELEDSDVSDDGSEYTEGVQSIIEQLESTNIQGKDGGKGIKGKGSARIGTFPASCRLPSPPPTYGTGEKRKKKTVKGTRIKLRKEELRVVSSLRVEADASSLLFYFFSRVEDRTQGLALARQVLYH
ncbi:hypothetical protein STEG23_031560 [Scotinomys teguina]